MQEIRLNFLKFFLLKYAIEQLCTCIYDVLQLSSDGKQYFNR